MTMYLDALETVRDNIEKSGRSIPQPCYGKRVERFKEAFARHFPFSLPGDVENFLLRSNGLEWNGVVFLGVDDDSENGKINDFGGGNGLLGHNSPVGIPREKLTLLYLGYSDMDKYVYDSEEDEYLIIDEDTGQPGETFSSFDELLTGVLTELLEAENE